MGMARRFQDLQVWRKAHEVVLETYRVSADFPRHEIYGLTAQLRRSAVSIPANMAGGFRKRGRADKARFLNVGEGSLEETRYCFILAPDLGYADCRGLLGRLDEVARTLAAYSRAILRPPGPLTPGSVYSVF
jgi:four helix bundle protein